MERNSGIFNEIPDFRNFKSKIGVSTDENENENDESEQSNNLLLDNDVVFTFYDKSNGTLKPGKGPNEKINKNKTRDYSDLNLKKNSEWRKKLDDDWSTIFIIDNMKWKTVEHYYQASKFKKHNPHFYKLFSLDSSDQISKDVELAKIAGSQKGSYKKGKTEIQLRPLDMKIDPDFYGSRKYEEREKAVYAKFSQNEDLKAIILATKNAVLKRYIPKSQSEPDNILMKVRKQLEIENGI